MSFLALLVGVALAGQVNRYGDSAAGSPGGSNQQRGTSAIMDSYGGGQAAGSSTSNPPQPQSYPPPAGGRLGDAYPGGASGSTPNSTSPATGSQLGDVYVPGRSQISSANSPGASAPPPPQRGLLQGANSGLSSARDLNAIGAGSASNEPRLKPVAMMRAMLAPRSESRLGGEWVTLDDVIAGASSRADQSERIEAYWDLCSSVADYFLGLREQEEMRGLRARYSGYSATLDGVEKDLAVRVGTAERAARASQIRLATLCDRAADRLPLPAHAPHCGSYQTRHDQVFAGRSSAEADELSLLIPLRYAELQDACDAVLRSEDWSAALAASRTTVDEPTILARLELLALQRRAFVQISRDYNRRISRYVSLAAPGQLDSTRLIGMLIKRDAPATATRPTIAPPPNRQSQVGPGGRQTFADGDDGWTAIEAAASTARRDDSVTPVSGEITPIESSERSLLVPRQ